MGEKCGLAMDLLPECSAVISQELQNFTQR